MPDAVKEPSFLVGAAMIIGGLASGDYRYVVYGAILIAGALMAPGPVEEAAILRNRMISGRDATASWNRAYGDHRLGGVYSYMSVSGSQRQYLNLILTLASHEVDAINEMYFDNKLVPVTGNDATGKYAGYVKLYKHLGAIDQTYDTALASQMYASWAGGRDGIYMDGRGQYAETAANSDLNLTTMTIQFWFRPREDADGVLMSLNDGSDWKVEWLGATKQVKFTDASGNTVTSGDVSNVGGLGKPASGLHGWVNIAIVGTPSEIKLYVNGSTIVTNTVAFDGGTGPSVFRICTLDGNTPWFFGNLARVWIFSDERTLTEIVNNMNNTLPNPSDNLQGRWSLDETSGIVASDGTANNNHLNLISSWTSDHRMQGRAYVYIRLQWNENKFPNGLPNITFNMRGKKLLDPRTIQTVTSFTNDAGSLLANLIGHGLSDGDQLEFSTDDTLPTGLSADVSYWVRDSTANDFHLATTPDAAAIVYTDAGVGPNYLMEVAYSNNPALIVLDYLKGQDTGLRAPLTEIDQPSFNVAANICEESVALDLGGTESRYTCNGSFTVEKTPQNILDGLLTSMGGQLVYVGGLWTVYAAGWRAPTVSLAEDDLVSGLRIQTLISRRENFNAVKGIYVSPDNNWIANDYPPVLSTTYEAEDGEQIFKDFALSYTTSPSMAQRLAKIYLERARQHITVAATAKLVAFQVQPPNVIQLNNTRMGWVNKEFEVIQGSLVLQGNTPSLGYSMQLRETASGVYDWTPATDEKQLDLAPNTLLPDPFLVYPPDNVTLESGTNALDLRLDGTIFSRIKVSWDAIDDEFINDGGQVEIQYRKSVNSIWLPLGFVAGNLIEAFILDVKDGTLYDVRVRAVNKLGNTSEWIAFDDHTVIGKTETPEDVQNFIAQQNGSIVTFIWDQVSDLDLSGYEIRYSKIGLNWADATPLTETLKGTRVTDAAVPPSPLPAGGTREPWKFFIKAVDTSGNYSDVATIYELVVTPLFDAQFAVNQFPNWPGVITNMIRDPKTGYLNVEDQTDASADNFDVFDNYIVTAPTSYGYEAQEIDIGFDDTTRVWSDIQGYLAPGESGILNPSKQLDYRLAADSYDGFELWTVGQLIARYFKMLFSQLTATGVIVITDFIPNIDVIEHIEADIPLTVPVGGLNVTFQQAFREIPDVEVVADTAAYFESFHSITKTGFSVWILDSGGTDVGDTATYTATGV